MQDYIPGGSKNFREPLLAFEYYCAYRDMEAPRSLQKLQNVPEVSPEKKFRLKHLNAILRNIIGRIGLGSGITIVQGRRL